MVNKPIEVIEGEISWVEWHFLKDMDDFKKFYVINSFYSLEGKFGETRIVKITDSFYDLGEYETLKRYKTIEETEKGHKEYNEKFKRGELKCTLLS